MARRSLFRDDVKDLLSGLGVFESDYEAGHGFSSAFWRDLGFTDSGEARRNWLEHVHREDRPGVEETLRRVWEGETDYFESEFRVLDSAGEAHWVLSKGYVVERAQTGEPLRYLGLDVDIDMQKALENFYHMAMEEAQRKARESEALRKAGAIITSSLQIHEAVSLILEQAHNVISYTAAVVLQRQSQSVEVIGTEGIPDDRLAEGSSYELREFGELWEQLSRLEPVSITDARLNQQLPLLEHLRISRGSLIIMPLVAREQVIGLLAFYDLRAEAFSRDTMRLALAFAQHVAVALQNAELFEEIRFQAATDSLTGTATRRSFFEYGRTLSGRAARTGRPLSLLMIDFDHFKTINDSYGHQEGDRILKEASRVITGTLRDPDTVGRYGGEEFAVLLRDESVSAAEKVATRILAHLAEIPVGNERHPFGPFTASIGVAEMQSHGAGSIEELIQFADRALYRAKTAGRNRVVVYQPDGSSPPIRDDSGV